VVYTTNDDGKCDPLEVKHIFCFPYGCTVFWGCTKEEEERFIAMLQPFAVEPVSDMEREESYDDFAYLYGASPLILHYEITLTSNDPEEKLALSFSLAQSAKLFVFEDRVDGTITSTKHIPIHLAEFGKINVSRREISKLTGKVFLERNEVNLHSDILDTPEWFWEADLWEPRYVAFCKYLDLPNRINILNKRLDILRELLNVLETQLDNSHSTKVSRWVWKEGGREGVFNRIVVFLSLSVLPLSTQCGCHFLPLVPPLSLSLLSSPPFINIVSSPPSLPPLPPSLSPSPTAGIDRHCPDYRGGGAAGVRDRLERSLAPGSVSVLGRRREVGGEGGVGPSFCMVEVQ